MKSDPNFAYTEALMEAGGVSRLTIASWVQAGLLPTPESVSPGGPGGHANRYPAWAVERARFIGAKRRAGYTKGEILAMLRERGEPNSSEGKKSARRR